LNLFNPANSIEKDTSESKYFVINSHKILSFKNENFIRPLSSDELSWSGLEIKRKHFLGYLNKVSCFVVATDGECALNEAIFTDLRSILGRIPDDLFSVISRAIQIQHWFESHKFCGYCGSELVENTNERAMICNHCDAPPAYPKISPCVITLIHRKNEILLAHNVNFPDNFYSTLAGFIESGESVEAALEREVLEEVGIKVKNIKYFGSQSWPFPSQLMLGYFAEFDSGEISPDLEEIDKADWFKIDNLPNTPPANISISGKLIEYYVKENS